MQSVLLIFAIFSCIYENNHKNICKTLSLIFLSVREQTMKRAKKELERVIVGLHALSSCVSEELLGSVGRSSSLVISNAERFPRLVVGGGIV